MTKLKSLSKEKIIVKVQDSISPSGEVLVYNEDNSIWFNGRMPKDVKRELKGELKAYFKAHISKDKQIVLDKMIGEQAW